MSSRCWRWARVGEGIAGHADDTVGRTARCGREGGFVDGARALEVAQSTTADNDVAKGKAYLRFTDGVGDVGGLSGLEGNLVACDRDVGRRHVTSDAPRIVQILAVNVEVDKAVAEFVAGDTDLSGGGAVGRGCEGVAL